MEVLLQNFRYAFRRLAKSPGFTAVAVLTLGLGMGATTAVFTLLKRVVLDPLPYPRPDELVRLKSPVPGIGPREEWNVSPGAYFFFRAQSRTTQGIAAYVFSTANVEVPGEPLRVAVATVSAETLPLLGAAADQGRLISHEDDVPGAPGVAVLSHPFWVRQFGADRSAVGRTITVNIWFPDSISAGTIPNFCAADRRSSASTCSCSFISTSA